MEQKAAAGGSWSPKERVDGGGGIDDWNSAAKAFNVTVELVRRGYTEEQVGTLWSGNLLRVWGEVENVAQRLQPARR